MLDNEILRRLSLHQHATGRARVFGLWGGAQKDRDLTFIEGPRVLGKIGVKESVAQMRGNDSLCIVVRICAEMLDQRRVEPVDQAILAERVSACEPV